MRRGIREDSRRAPAAVQWLQEKSTERRKTKVAPTGTNITRQGLTQHKQINMPEQFLAWIWWIGVIILKLYGLSRPSRGQDLELSPACRRHAGARCRSRGDVVWPSSRQGLMACQGGTRELWNSRQKGNYPTSGVWLRSSEVQLGEEFLSSVFSQTEKKSAVKTPSSFDSETNEEDKVIKQEYISLLNYFCTVVMSNRKPQVSCRVIVSSNYFPLHVE